MKRILVLAGVESYSAGSFLRAAEQLGITVLVGVNGSMPAGGAVLPLDYTHRESSLRRVADLGALDGVVAVDDSGVRLAAEISAAQGLHSSGVEAVVSAANKHVMRQVLDNTSAGGIWYQCHPLHTDPLQLASDLRYPCVLKPLNLNASRGVMRVDNPQQFIQRWQQLANFLQQAPFKADTKSHILVEAYLEGAEVALEGIIEQGQLQVLALWDKPAASQGPFFEESMLITPSQLTPQQQAQVIATTQVAVNALGLKQGPIHAEFRINTTAQLLEIAPRCIGGKCGKLLEFQNNLNLHSLILQNALGQSLPKNLLLASPAVGVCMLHPPQSGRLQAVAGQSKARAAGAILELTAHTGQWLHATPYGNQYLGFLFARCHSTQQVLDVLNTARSHLHIQMAE